MPATRRATFAITKPSTQRKTRGGAGKSAPSLRQPSKRLVDSNPETKYWVYGQSTPDASFLNRTWTHFKKTTLLTYQEILRGVVAQANALQMQGYKVTDIQGGTKKPVTFVDDTATPFRARSALFDMAKSVFERTTEFTIYYRKYERETEPLARSIDYCSKLFSFSQKDKLRKYLANRMSNLDVLCHVDISDTGVFQEFLLPNKGNLRTTSTRVIVFYRR